MTANGTPTAVPVWSFTVMRRAICRNVCVQRLQKTQPKPNKAELHFRKTNMLLRTERKILLLALAACFVFSVIIAETMIAGSRDHDCIGKDCLICMIIKTANNLLKPASNILFLIGCLVFLGRIHKCDTGHNACPLSPVALKVRFNS